MVDRLVVAILRHIHDRETILARRRHVLGGRIFRRALKAISTRASPRSEEGWSPPLVWENCHLYSFLPYNIDRPSSLANALGQLYTPIVPR